MTAYPPRLQFNSLWLAKACAANKNELPAGFEKDRAYTFISQEEHAQLIKQAKAEAYNDAAKCVAHGFSFASIYGIIAKKAVEVLG